MKIIRGFDENLYRKICKRSGSSQAVKDVAYTRVIVYGGKKIYAERIDEIGCIFGYFNHTKSELRIICVAVDEQFQHRGAAQHLLMRAMQAAKENGVQYVRTKTKTGRDFYIREGFVEYGRKGDDSLLEAMI